VDDLTQVARAPAVLRRVNGLSAPRVRAGIRQFSLEVGVFTGLVSLGNLATQFGSFVGVDLSDVHDSYRAVADKAHVLSAGRSERGGLVIIDPSVELYGTFPAENGRPIGMNGRLTSLRLPSRTRPLENLKPSGLIDQRRQRLQSRVDSRYQIDQLGATSLKLPDRF